MGVAVLCCVVEGLHVSSVVMKVSWFQGPAVVVWFAVDFWRSQQSLMLTCVESNRLIEGVLR